ncbi:TRS120 targeting complex component [Spathaspora passalidarum NRRL Y-27907]|uniref:TRS120 targeting complex component n=1 Tax=Spathaspora passalidarum (strain NRRL Y-27907 / 11-Y1) TaxID=619300 RepID=G3AIK8_SPAPN|nr:TRS120 targeting complex component [Spathaspora passalidarum NRRL Y-27907]EGW33723.1 TRS120 targeting complex component [Spathaspora passalidarum NRRL Y-27907]
MSDKYNFIAPAIVKVLVVPINNCTKANFTRYLQLLHSNVSEVRLLDITPNSDLSHFNPASFPNGRIFIEFTTTTIDQESIFLHDFEPFRKTFIVIAVGTYSEELNAQQHLDAIKTRFPTTIMANSIMFDTPSVQVESLNKLNPDVFYHDGTTNKLTALETIFCDICGNFLNELDSYASSFANITLRSPVSITDSHVLTKAINKAQKRISLGGSTSFKVSFNGNSAPTSMETKSKTHLRHLGRQRKLMGNFYLLSGKYHDALQSFIEGLQALRKCDDYLWLASALEGMAVSIVLLQFIGSQYTLPSQILCPILQVTKSKMNSLSDPTLSPRKSSIDSQSSKITTNLSPRTSFSGATNGFTLNSLTSTPDLNTVALPELLNVVMSRALSFYDLSTNDFEDMVPDIVYVESILRNIRLMIGFHLSNGEMASTDLENIIRGKKTESATYQGYFYRSDILAEIDKIFQLQLVDLPIIDQCRIYSVLASMYSDLGMMRKRAFILRTLLVGLLPDLEKQSSTTTPGQIQSIREIVDFLFVLYGINSEPEVSAEAASFQSQSNWPALQIQFLKLCMKIGENINDKEFLLKLCTLLLTRYTHNLPEDDQIRLKEKVESLIFQSTIDKLSLSVPYWDPFMVRRAKFVNSKQRDELIPFNEYLENGVSQESTDSFFDPYQKTVEVSVFEKDKLLIKDDVNHLKITLQNPFAFEIEINDLEIATEGDVQVETIKSLIRAINPSPSQQQSLNNTIRASSMTKVRGLTKKASPVNSTSPNNFSSSSSQTSSVMVVPPNSTEQFLVAFRALHVGQLKIIGFRASIGPCKPQFFPIVDKELYAKSVKITDHSISEVPNTLDKVIANLKNASIESRATTRKLVLNVISRQPTLTLTDTSVTNGWIMLLDGEKFDFSIRLTNHSPVTINYLSFSFWDSTIEPLNNKLNSAGVQNTLDAAEMYEIEWALVKFKPFRIVNKDEIAEKYKTIGPGDDIEIDYEVTGRKGMDLSKIILDYAHKNSDDIPNSFVKHIHIPLNISVMPAIEVVGCDILPLFASSLQGLDVTYQHNPGNLNQVLQFISGLIESKKDVSDYCLFIIDLRNSWTDKLRINLKYSDSVEFEINDSIVPDKTSRFLIPIKRIKPNEIDFTKPIPSLRNRQFVKNYNLTEEAEKLMQKLFWLRDHILLKLSGSWSGSDDARHGTIDLRPLRLTAKNSSILVYDNILINHSICDESDTPLEKQGTQYCLQADEFYILKTTIVNNSESPITGIIRHLPIPRSITSSIHPTSVSFKAQLSIDRKILFNGVLQNKISDVPLQPGAKLELELSFVIIERGEFEWATVLEVLAPESAHYVGHEPTYIMAI